MQCRVDESAGERLPNPATAQVWHFPDTSISSDELFADYVNTFVKITQEASGYPKNCATEEQKQQYIEEYFEREGIHLDPNKIEKSPGLRAPNKLNNVLVTETHIKLFNRKYYLPMLLNWPCGCIRRDKPVF